MSENDAEDGYEGMNARVHLSTGLAELQPSCKQEDLDDQNVKQLRQQQKCEVSAEPPSHRPAASLRLPSSTSPSHIPLQQALPLQQPSPFPPVALPRRILKQRRFPRQKRDMQPPSHKHLSVASSPPCQQECDEESLSFIPSELSVVPSHLHQTLNRYNKLAAFELRFYGHTLVSVNLHKREYKKTDCILDVYTDYDEQGLQPIHMYGININQPDTAYNEIPQAIRDWHIWHSVRRLCFQLRKLDLYCKRIIAKQHVGWAEDKTIRERLKIIPIPSVRYSTG